MPKKQEKKRLNQLLTAVNFYFLLQTMVLLHHWAYPDSRVFFLIYALISVIAIVFAYILMKYLRTKSIRAQFLVTFLISLPSLIVLMISLIT